MLGLLPNVASLQTRRQPGKITMQCVKDFRDEQLAAEAIEWIGRLEDSSPFEHEAFADWLTRSPDHIREFLTATAILEELSGRVGYGSLGGILSAAPRTGKTPSRLTASGAPRVRSHVSESGDWEIRIVRHAVSQLPEACRRALTLRKVYGWSRCQIADRLDMSEEAVERHLTQANRQLACLLESAN